MASFTPPSISILKDKVVVVTGGAQGIGAALVTHLHSAGAHVFFGDISTIHGNSLAQKLSSSSSPTSTTAPLTSAQTSSTHIEFLSTDVRSYEDNIKLFDAAYARFGRIDHAVAAAGISEEGNVFNPDLTLETVRSPPPTNVLNVNLLGAFYFARIASVYLRQNTQAPKSPQVKGNLEQADKSLTLISSVAGLLESPGLFVYQTSKHGVVGLMRALRQYLPCSSPQGIRVNAVCPWMTLTQMVRGLEEKWKDAGLPSNTPLDVAKVIVGAMVDRELNGASLYVEGGRAWEVEREMERLRPQWMGEEQAIMFDRGQEVLRMAARWTKR